MWTEPADLKDALMRLWNRGEFMRDLVEGRSRFPLRIPLKGPKAADITHRFDSVRRWVATLTATRFIRIEWTEVRHRVQGEQQIPLCVWVDSLDDALRWLGKRAEYDEFVAILDRTRTVCAPLVSWLARYPLRALDLARQWESLLLVVTWIQAHPRPGIYLRQVDIPGIHTKFIESHRATLSDLLDLALEPDLIDLRHSGVSGFTSRYGFLDKPVRIRFRVLDPRIQIIDAAVCPDVTLDVTSFAQLHLAVRRVIITENETNFLALPELEGTVAVFGAGYGWEALARARWLERCRICYWGDIDTHGFAILDQLRSHFLAVESVLMDRQTLMAHAMYWGEETRPYQGDLRRLHIDELSLFNDLRDNRIRPGLRLEQELLGYEWVRDRLQALVSQYP